ncbi:MAG TPA: hypothetical protein VGL92_13290, partial [Acidimicrobiia bacterium]
MQLASVAPKGRKTSGNGSPNGSVPPEERFLTQLLAGLKAAAAGEPSVRLSTRKAGLSGDVAKAFNDLNALHNRLNREMVRVSKAIGRDGRTTERVDIGPVTGTWVTRVDAVNSMIEDLVRPTNEVARVISAVAEGDLTQKMPLAI